MTSTGPPSPLTNLAAAAVQMHELFRAYVDAGSSEAQAMQLLCAQVQAMSVGRQD